jgi:putative flavoprotein involved in K+ transport
VLQEVDVVVIGAGQCGLSIGYRLQRMRRDFVILDGAPAIGHSWRARYDSLKLFTPTIVDALPGLRFPDIRKAFPSKDELADYLALYAHTFSLPVRLNARVEGLRAADGRYEIRTASDTYMARQVVVATGAFQHPRIPAFASGLSPKVHQVHSSAYRNPAGLPAGPDVLVVGAANSGAQIALELASGRKTYLAEGGRAFYSSPRWLLERPSAWRIARRALQSRKRRDWPWPLGNTQPFFVGNFFEQVRSRGVEMMPRVVAAQGSEVTFADGRVLTTHCIVWATGYRPDYSWIALPIFDEKGLPQLQLEARAAPGLYFVGLWRQRTLASALIMGTQADSRYVADMMAADAAAD